MLMEIILIGNASKSPSWIEADFNSNAYKFEQKQHSKFWTGFLIYHGQQLRRSNSVTIPAKK